MEEIEEYLEELVYKIRLKKYVEKWDKILSKIKPSEEGFSEKSIRDDRESY